MGLLDHLIFFQGHFVIHENLLHVYCEYFFNKVV